MIVRPRPHGLEYFFILRGSILHAIWVRLAITIVTAILVSLAHGSVYHFKITLTATPFSLIGLALAIFLGFRNSASYERFWEGRKLWGSLIVASRDLTRQIESFILPRAPAEEDEVTALRRRLVHTLMAFAHALRHHLRDSDAAADLQRLLPPEAIPAAVGNRPAAMLHGLGGDLRLCLQRGWLDPILAQEIDRGIGRLSDVLGGCERIRNTPIPFSYSVLLHRTVYLYCYLLPFGLVDSIGIFTPLVVGIVAYTFFGLDAIGDEIEEPFGTTANDLPLTTLSYAIEINLRELTGEGDLPAMPQPVNFCLN